MSVLKALESKIAGLVEGAFSRAFRSEVRPVEIARKLAREMEEHKAVSVSRVYVPNEYTVYLSRQDRGRFKDLEEALVKDLSGYLLEHAREEKLALLSRPVIEFRTDDQLSLGEFGIQARVVHAPADPEGAPEQGEKGHTMIFNAAPAADAAPEPVATRPPPAASALVLFNGKRMAVGPGGAVLGRSRGCEVVIPDANVSRRHAEIRPAGDGWTVSDLGSTNGVSVNGRPVRSEHPLRSGDRIELGSTELSFQVE